jgi:hypothetical protein
MTSYVNPFTGQTINPANVGYESYTISANLSLEWPINGNDQSPIANILEINATAAGLLVYLPPATQVSTGQALLVRNTGANSFNVTDNGGNLIATIASGIAEFIYLTDNSTTDGVWSAFTFGAGVSAANAVQLAGNGLVAINTLLNSAIPATLVSSDYSFVATDRAKFFVWEGGSGALYLPSSNAVGANWYVIVRNNGTGILTIQTQGTDTLDGAATAQLQPGESFVVVCTVNGTGFNSFAYGRSANFFFTQLALVTTGGTTTLSSVQAANTIQEYSGALTSNATIVLPPTVQLYAMSNNTTGAYTLTFTTGVAGGSTFSLAQGQTALLVCDGTNVYSATSATVVSSTALTLANGSAAAPSLNFTGDTTTGLYLIGSGQIGIAIGGVLGFSLSAAGMLVPVGIAGGTF